MTYLLLMIIFFLFCVFTAISYVVIYWKLFKKAGQPGWAAIIPFYSTYAMAKIAKSPTLGIAAMTAAIVSYILSLTGVYKAVPGLSFFAIISGLIGLVVFAKFVKMYDASLGLWVLYVLFPVIGVFFIDETNYKDPTVQATQPAQPGAPVVPAATPIVSGAASTGVATQSMSDVESQAVVQPSAPQVASEADVQPVNDQPQPPVQPPIV